MSKKYASEIFGFPPDNKTLIAKKFRRTHICPFTDMECDPINKKSNLIDEKTGKLLLPHQSGACSAWYKPKWSDSPYPVIICPMRFEDHQIVFRYIKDKIFQGKKVVFVPEVGVGEFGRVDWIACSYSSWEDIHKTENLAHVEIQSDATTGTRELVKCVADFYRGEDISSKNYNYGMNSKASVKGSSLQMIDKGILFERLKKKSIWVIQDYLFKYLLRVFPFSYTEVGKALPKDKNLFFLVSKLVRNRKLNKFELRIDNFYVTSTQTMRDSIAKKVHKFSLKELITKVEEKMVSSRCIQV